MHACLVKISPLNTTSGAREDVYLSSHDDRRVTGLDGHTWSPSITAGLVLGLALWNGDFTAATAPGAVAIPVNLDALAKIYPNAPVLFWIGADVEIHIGEPGGTWDFGAPFMAARIASLSGSYPQLIFQAQVDSEPLSASVLTSVYAGTGGANGGADIKNRAKPLVLGWAKNVEPVLIDAVNYVYQFSGYGAIEGVATLYERASAFSAALGDHADYTALVAATVPEGTWATCLAAGMVRLGAPSAGVITGDIKGHKVGATTPRLTGAVVQAMATIAGVSSGLIDSSSLTDLDADKPYPINLVLSSQTSFVDIARDLVLACNWQASVSRTGKFQASKVSLTPAADITLNAQGRALPLVTKLEQQSVSPPYWRTVMGADRSWRVHSADEIATAYELIEKGAYDAAETYREGNIVQSTDGSRWLYINATPSAGNAPPTWPTTSNTWWENLSPPIAADIPTWVLDAATNFNADNDANGLIPPSATALSITSTIATDGSATLTGAWTYTTSSDPAAANNIDGFIVGYYPQTSATAWTYGPASADTIIWEVLEPDRRKYVLGGQAADRYWWMVVIPFRFVRTDVSVSGKVLAVLAQTSSASGHRPAATVNYQGNIGGVAAATIGSTVTNVNANNDNNGLTPPGATSLSMTSVTYPDSTAQLTGSWAYTNSTTPSVSNNIDGFLVGLYKAESSAAFSYVYGGAQDSQIHWIWVEPHVRSVVWSGMTMNRYFWLVVIPYRRVDSNININNIILGPAAQSLSWTRPQSTVEFTGNIAGLLASAVVIGSNRATTAINGSNQLNANTVPQAAILAGAINETDYVAQGSTVVQVAGTSGGAQIMLTGQVVGSDGRMVVRFVPSWYFERTGPVQGTTYSGDMEIVLTNGGGTVVYASSKYTVKERWDSPSSGATVTMEQRVGVIEHYFSGVTPGTYGVGYRITAPATNSVYLPAYRYMTARAPRADE